MCPIYVVISEIQEMLSNLHEFISEVDCQIIFFINCIYFSQVQVTLPHYRRKIKRLRWFVCR